MKAVINLNQIKIINAISSEISRQYPGVTVAADEFSAIIAAANSVKAAYDGKEVTTSDDTLAFSADEKGFLPVVKHRNRPEGPYLSLGPQKSGLAYCRINEQVRAEHNLVEFEFNETEKVIRLRPNDTTGTALHGRNAGNFQIGKKYSKKLLVHVCELTYIALTKSDDGWWYGNLPARTDTQYGSLEGGK